MEGSKEYIDYLQGKLDDCVEREWYEMAARLRDLLEHERTESEEYKNRYYVKLLTKYCDDTAEFKEHINNIKKKYNIDL